MFCIRIFLWLHVDPRIHISFFVHICHNPDSFFSGSRVTLATCLRPQIKLLLMELSPYWEPHLVRGPGSGGSMQVVTLCATWVWTSTIILLYIILCKHQDRDTLVEQSPYTAVTEILFKFNSLQVVVKLSTVPKCSM